jgi:hypothetical protein
MLFCAGHHNGCVSGGCRSLKGIEGGVDNCCVACLAAGIDHANNAAHRIEILLSHRPHKAEHQNDHNDGCETGECFANEGVVHDRVPCFYLYAIWHTCISILL